MWLLPIAPSSLVLAILTLALLTTVSCSASLSIPLSCDPGASPYVDPRFPSFAFEEASFVEYALDATGKPNTLSQNLMKAIFDRTSSHPIIRVGGTSCDFGRLVSNQSEPALPVAAQNSYQNVGNTTIGLSYWTLFKSFPDASFVFQVPIGINNVSQAAAYAVSGVSVIGLENIDAIEIGNEPDLYPNNNALGVLLEPPKYQGAVTNESYVDIFGAFASAVSSALHLPAQKPIFQAFDTSHRFDASEGYELDVATVFNAGLNRNNTIKAVSHHFYQTSTSNGTVSLQSGLMNHQAIATELDYLRPFISYCHSTTTGTHSSPIPFVLGEVGNSLNHGNNYTYQNVLGSALWQVDFQLYALAIGISRVYWQQIMHAGYDLWLPVASAGLPAQVFANFYAQPFIADFISSGGVTRVSQMNLTEAPDYVVAYAAFENERVERIAVVNLNLWDGSGGGTRLMTELTFSVPRGVEMVEVRKLSSPEGAYANASSITYAGSQWTASSNGEQVFGVDPSGVTTHTVRNGVVTLSVEDSSALVVTLHWWSRYSHQNSGPEFLQ